MDRHETGDSTYTSVMVPDPLSLRTLIARTLAALATPYRPPIAVPLHMDTGQNYVPFKTLVS